MTHYTHTDCTPEEAAAAWVRKEHVEFFDPMLERWLPLLGDHQLDMFTTGTLFRIRHSAPQETVEEAIRNQLRFRTDPDEYFLRICAALKREILEEVRK